jgi:hypothetical protein
VLEWLYRRGRFALAALLAAAEATLDDFSPLADAWDYSQAFARAWVEPAEFYQLSALLRREASRARPSAMTVPAALDLGIGQDWAQAAQKLPACWVSLPHVRRRELMLTPAGDTSTASEGDEGQLPDESAFRPAKEFLDAGRFGSYKRLRAALEGNPWVRTRKPSKQRLEIHAGDWHRYLAMLDAAGFDALDVAGETADAFMAEVRRRQAEITRRKAGK